MSNNTQTVTVIRKSDGVAANANGHVYPTGVLEKAVQQAQDQIKAKTLLGGFYIDGAFQEYPAELSSRSHIVESLVMKGGDMIASIKLLDTEKGRRLADSIKMGYKPEIGLACQGEIVDNVVTEAKILSIDVIGFEIDEATNESK